MSDERPEKPIGTRWSHWHKNWIKRRDVDAFVMEIARVCRKHGFALGVSSRPHPFGTLLVTELRQDTIETVLQAEIGSSIGVRGQELDDERSEERQSNERAGEESSESGGDASEGRAPGIPKLRRKA